MSSFFCPHSTHDMMMLWKNPWEKVKSQVKTIDGMGLPMGREFVA